jgi:aminobutyraldehyde dehydrogenase
LENFEELAQLEARNVGKPIGQAREEIEVGADMLRFFAGAGRRLDGIAAGEYAEGFTSYLRREPIGVVAVVAPWNYPFMLTCVKIGAVLAAGNTLLLKPADQTPLSAICLGRLLEEVFPADVLRIVTGTGADVGARRVEHPDVRAFALTGGTETGRRVAEVGGNTLKRLILELGSKNAGIVFDDADLDEAAQALAIGGFVNSGQDCGAASRILVQANVYDRFVEKYVAAVDGIITGNPFDESTTMGPVFTQEHQRRVLGFIERARNEGGEIVRGGGAAFDKGFFVQPTVVLASNDSELARNEVFGPVVSIHRVDSDEHAIKVANDVDAGLAASVFTNDVRRGMNATRRLDFGTTWINTHIPMANELPWGGFKNSGNGLDLSALALEQYTRVKHVMIQL